LFLPEGRAVVKIFNVESTFWAVRKEKGGRQLTAHNTKDSTFRIFTMDGSQRFLFGTSFCKPALDLWSKGKKRWEKDVETKRNVW